MYRGWMEDPTENADKDRFILNNDEMTSCRCGSTRELCFEVFIQLTDANDSNESCSDPTITILHNGEWLVKGHSGKQKLIRRLGSITAFTVCQKDYIFE